MEIGGSTARLSSVRCAQTQEKLLDKAEENPVSPKQKYLFLKLQIWQAFIAILEAQEILFQILFQVRWFLVSFPKICVSQAKKQSNTFY